MNRVITLSILALLFSACNHQVTIKDGQIPAEFIPQVEKYLGDYASVEVNDNINLALDGNRAILTLSGDLLELGCDQAVGALKALSVRGGKNNETLATASFELNSALCLNPVWGKTVELTFNNHDPRSVKVTLLTRMNMEQRCELMPPQGNQICHWEERPVYESVVLSKK